ncbi:MAG: hypothetical protein JNM09_29810 [Blastocatellia bacterium]|nr:hypothetical protein [Blastocatellia bacterium]
MNKPKLVKRGEVSQARPAKPTPTAVTIQKTMNGVKDWLNTRQQNTRQSARDAFASLFVNTQETCTEC